MMDDRAHDQLEAHIARITSRPGIPLHVRDAIAAELRAHFEDAVEAGSADPLADFGNTELIGNLVARAASRRDGGGTMRLMGLACTAILIAAAIAMGGTITAFVNIPSIILVIGLGCTFGMTAWGPNVFFGAYVAAAKALLAPGSSIAALYAARVIRGHILQVYGAGVIGVSIGLIQMLVTLDDPSTLSISLAVMLLPPFYSLCLAEGLLRPALRAIEFGGNDTRPEGGTAA